MKIPARSHRQRIHVKKLLYKYCFGHVWFLQGVGDETLIWKFFKQRLSVRLFHSGLAL